MVYDFESSSEDKEEFDCINKSSGCLITLKRREILIHIESCTYSASYIRLCQHLGYNCSYLTPINSVHQAFHHFTQNHSFSICDSDVVDIRLEGFCAINRTERSRWTPLILDLESKLGVQLLILSLFNCHDQTVAIECIQLNAQFKNLQAEFKVDAVDPLKTLDLKWSIAPVNIRLAAVATKPFIQYKIDQLYPYVKDDALTIRCSIIKRDFVYPTEKFAETASLLNVVSVCARENIYAYPEFNHSVIIENSDTQKCAPPLPPRNLHQQKLVNDETPSFSISSGNFEHIEGDPTTTSGSEPSKSIISHSYREVSVFVNYESCEHPLPPRNPMLQKIFRNNEPPSSISSGRFRLRKHYGGTLTRASSYKPSKSITCQSCRGTNLFEYYKCLQCPKFILCKSCMESKIYRQHIFARIWNRKQEAFLMGTWRISKQWRPFFLEQMAIFGDIDGLRDVELLCSSCANYKNGLAKYICLNCNTACRLCTSCFEDTSKQHFEDHLFVVVDTLAKSRLVISSVKQQN